MSLEFPLEFFNSLSILFLQLPKDSISARLTTNPSENTENTFIFTALLKDIKNIE